MPSEARGSPKFLRNPCALGLATRHFSEVLQERQELVAGPIAAWSALERIGFGQRLLFEREICMEISLGCFHRFMAQPERDNRTVDPVLE